MLGISLDSPETLLKYIGGIHSYMRHTILMFNPTSIEEVFVQATHLKARGKNGNPEVGGPSQPTVSKSKEKIKQKWKERKANTAQVHALTVKRRGMMMSIVGFCIQS